MNNLKELKTVKVEEVVFRKDLYPRFNHDQEKAQEYASNIDNLPPILVNQRYELIDGFHRLTAHRLARKADINCEIHETGSDAELLEMAIRTNATHGLQLSQADKKMMAIKLYGAGERTADRKKALSTLLSVGLSTITGWVTDLDKAAREERAATIKEMWHRCFTSEEIGEAVGLPRRTVDDQLSAILTDLLKSPKVTFSEEDYAPPIYNIWSYAKKTNEVSHFGNTEQRIVDNLLYLYTEPVDIVVDPFAGGGSTLDVCRKRGRRCWLSDRKPKPGMEGVIRELDIVQSLPDLHKRWSEVSLTYLDPPYWRQAYQQYSSDSEDLANMPLEQFTSAMIGIVENIARKQSKGVIALIIQPTQWNSENKGDFTDHVLDIISGVKKVLPQLQVENRVSCPYSSEQANAQMVQYAKENKKLLVLTRELIIWRVS